MKSWRCFHCDEVFTDRESAALHFGVDETHEAACKLNTLEGGLIELIRRQEAELFQFRIEDTASFRQFYILGAEHNQAIRAAEEKGYAKGVADMKAQGFCVEPEKHEPVT